MKTRNPAYAQFIRDIFAQAPYIQALGIEVVDVGVGWVETGLAIRPNHLQQNGYVHAGVQATLADHSAGGAAATLVAPDIHVLTVEFKINLLRPALCDRLSCRADVLKAGRTLTIVESTVTGHKGDEATLVSKATVTIANVAKR